jgi:hypothetical protein
VVFLPEKSIYFREFRIPVRKGQNLTGNQKA